MSWQRYNSLWKIIVLSIDQHIFRTIILSKEDLLNNGVKDVEINEDEFYVVDYNTEEVFYSLGIEGKYKLSEM